MPFSAITKNHRAMRLPSLFGRAPKWNSVKEPAEFLREHWAWAASERASEDLKQDTARYVYLRRAKLIRRAFVILLNQLPLDECGIAGQEPVVLIEYDRLGRICGGFPMSSVNPDVRKVWGRQKRGVRPADAVRPVQLVKHDGEPVMVKCHIDVAGCARLLDLHGPGEDAWLYCETEVYPFVEPDEVRGASQAWAQAFERSRTRHCGGVLDVQLEWPTRPVALGLGWELKDVVLGGVYTVRYLKAPDGRLLGASDGLSIEETSQLRMVARKTVLNWVHQRKLDGWLVGSQYVIPAAIAVGELNLAAAMSIEPV